MIFFWLLNNSNRLINIFCEALSIDLQFYTTPTANQFAAQCRNYCSVVLFSSPPPSNSVLAASPRRISQIHTHFVLRTCLCVHKNALCVFVRCEIRLVTVFFLCASLYNSKSSFVHTGITYCALNSFRSYTFVRSVCCVLSVANVRAFFQFASIILLYTNKDIAKQQLIKSNKFHPISEIDFLVSFPNHQADFATFKTKIRNFLHK